MVTDNGKTVESIFYRLCAQALYEKGPFKISSLFSLQGTKCAIVLYSWGNVVRNRAVWPCVYVQSNGRGNCSNISPDGVHGGITFGEAHLMNYEGNFIGCDFNHLCDSRNTLLDDFIGIQDSLQGLLDFVNT